MSAETVYLHVWTGDPGKGRAFVEQRYPGATVMELSHRELRDGGWKGQVRALRSLRGRALVVFFNSIDDCMQLQLVQWSGLLHHCKETVTVDERGHLSVYRRRDWLWMFPKAAISAMADLFVFLSFWFGLNLWRVLARPQQFSPREVSLDVAYLFPYPRENSFAGGAMSHIRGVLRGLAANDATCDIFSAVSLPAEQFSQVRVPSKRKFFVVWEALMLTYGLRFAREVRRHLSGVKPRLLYQRHGRFMIGGAALSWLIGVPLVLEYNASELEMAKHWDPTRFRTWLRLCEEVTLACSALIVVVSEPLRDGLIKRGIPADRILVNPNAVDPDFFHPNCGGKELRQELGISAEEVVVAFVGTFGPWHGIGVLQEAIRELLQDGTAVPLRFLLIGSGGLLQDIRAALAKWEQSGQVIFTGIVTHDRVRAYLDAADILVSPHVPMTDGTPFFGSPTKLFEYMAMGKAIAASRLDQLATVLTHDETAWLVPPADVKELVAAIQLLARDPALRRRLGNNAREAAIARHTWRQNAARMLARTSHAAKEVAQPEPELVAPGR